MRHVILFAAMALLVAGLAPRFYANMNAPAGASAKATAAEPPPETTNSRSMTIRSDNGHFRVEAAVDGRRMEFLVDTGASVIALRESDAGRLGIHPAQREYTVNASTANGMVRAPRSAPAWLRST